MKIYEILEEHLKTENNFVKDDGTLKKWVLINKAQNFDGELITLLLDNQDLKEKFFVDIKGTLVFNQNLFVNFMEQKNYLNDSYTQYKNKVGLTIGGKYLKQHNDVALVWPYKDCILEGGQGREEDKREEIFFNELLSQGEINQLLEPKVLTNAKVYDKDGEHAFGGFTRDSEINEKRGLSEDTITDNLIIKGNNLLALHSLKKEFAGKVKLIYIDPPYNTGSVANTFKYNNSFNHSTWLTFMKNRLEVAKILLKENGTLCIAIDDEEYTYLKVACDEILGRENYLGTIVVQSNPRGRTTNSYFATCHEYALFYAKNPLKIKVNNQTLTKEQESDFDKTDANGKYRLLPFRRSGGTSTPEERPNSEFSIYFDKLKGKIVAVGGERIDDHTFKYEPKEILQLNDTKEEIVRINSNKFLKKYKDIVSILPVDTIGKRRVWRWSDRMAILKAANNNDFHVVISKETYTIQLKDRIKKGRKPKTIWADSKYDASANGTMLLKRMFGNEKVFSYPKSLFTVKDTLQILTSSHEGDIVLDFFGGSATTAHALLELNQEDYGNRQFIIAEQLDYIESVTCERVHKVIQQNLMNSFIYFELKKHNQTFIEKIEQAKDTQALLKIWEQMKEKSFLNYNVDIKKQEDHMTEFKMLLIEEQKQHLCEILDKNKLYVNLSSLNDKDFSCTEEERNLTQDFYRNN